MVKTMVSCRFSLTNQSIEKSPKLSAVSSGGNLKASPGVHTGLCWQSGIVTGPLWMAGRPGRSHMMSHGPVWMKAFLSWAPYGHLMGTLWASETSFEVFRCSPVRSRHVRFWRRWRRLDVPVPWRQSKLNHGVPGVVFRQWGHSGGLLFGQLLWLDSLPWPVVYGRHTCTSLYIMFRMAKYDWMFSPFFGQNGGMAHHGELILGWTSNLTHVPSWPMPTW